MNIRSYSVLTISVLVSVIALSIYSYTQISIPLKDAFSEAKSVEEKIKNNDKILADTKAELEEVAVGYLQNAMSLQIKIKLLEKENLELRESLRTAINALSEKEDSISIIAVLGIIIALLAMMPAWVELFLKIKNRE